MAIGAGILEGTKVDAKPLGSDHGFRRIALIWRRSSPRESEFQMLAGALREITRDLIPNLTTIDPARPAEPALPEVCG
jgi:LysR family hydrogen peroxide-inducible transcriptional activator